MKKKNFKYKIIGILIGSGIIFSFLFFSIKYNWNFSFFLKDILYFPITVMDFDKDYKIILEERELELQKENDELKKLLNINKSLSDFKGINATVINRNTSYWNEELVINKGSSDGIKVGMAVIDGNGLVGRIIKTSLNTSIIRLITSTSKDNKISVKVWIDDQSINKVLEQDEEHNLIISGIDNNLNVKVGDIVTTSGLSDIYPSGIPIGTIEKIDNDKFGISKKVYIKNNCDLSNIRFVSVLIRSI